MKSMTARVSNKNSLKYGSRVRFCISAILPWIQYLHIYKFVTGVSLGYLILIILLVLWAFEQRNDLLHQNIFGTGGNKWLVLYLLYAIGSLPICILLSGDVLVTGILNKVIKLSVVIIAASVFSDYIDWTVFKKSLIIMGTVACFAVFVQFPIKLATGWFPSFKIPFLSYVNEHSDLAISSVSYIDRVSSIFLEPSHFTYFIFQCLVVVLFDLTINNRVRAVSSTMFTFAVVMCVSSTGLILLVITWVLFLGFLLKRRQGGRSSLLLALLLIVVFVAAAYFYLRSENLSFALYRMTDSYYNSDTVWIRLYAVSDDIANLEFVQLLFGLGLGNIESEFMNSIAYSILTTGLFGTALIIMWLLSCFYASSYCGKAAIVIFTLLAAIDVMAVYSPILAEYAIIVHHYEKRKNASCE